MGELATTGAVGNIPLTELLPPGDAAAVALAPELVNIAETDSGMNDLNTYFSEPAARIRDARPDELPVFGGSSTVVEYQDFTKGQDVANEVQAAAEAVAEGGLGTIRLFTGTSAADGSSNFSSLKYNSANGANQLLASVIGRQTGLEKASLSSLMERATMLRDSGELGTIEELFPLFADTPDQARSKEDGFMSSLRGIDKYAIMTDSGEATPDNKGLVKGVIARVNDPNTGAPTNTFVRIMSRGFNSPEEQGRQNMIFMDMLVIPENGPSTEHIFDESNQLPAAPQELTTGGGDNLRRTVLESQADTMGSGAPLSGEQGYDGGYNGAQVTKNFTVLDAQRQGGGAVMGPGGPVQSFRVDVPPQQ